LTALHALSFRNPRQVEPSTLALAYYWLSGLLALGLGIAVLAGWLP
jgi:hypothetical protein